MERRHTIVIVGGGTAGITVAAQLKRKNAALDIAIIEPSEEHYYQPLWTLVGGGVFKKEKSLRKTVDYIPKGVKWIKDFVASFSPASNFITTKSGDQIGYDFLVVAAGIQLDWHKIDGLTEALGKGGVCSNYGYEHSEYTWEVLRNLKKGNAIFTQPATLVKCGGAPQKIMYLTADYLRIHGHSKDVDINFMSPGLVVFANIECRETLTKVLNRYGITFNFQKELIAIKGKQNIAVFRETAPDGTVSEKEYPYDMIHVVPPQSAPDFVKTSALANADGWVEVDPGTLQHTRFENVFSLGDVSSTPNAKTGAAVRKQAPLVVANLLDVMQKGKIMGTKRYNGYTSCPLVTGYGKLVLAEFDYDNKLDGSFPFDTTKELWSMYFLKTRLLPIFYWYGMLKGRM